MSEGKSRHEVLTLLLVLFPFCKKYAHAQYSSQAGHEPRWLDELIRLLDEDLSQCLWADWNENF